MTYEDAVAELSRVLEALESGELPLEKSMRQYERGLALIRRCHQLLDEAALRLEQVGAAPGSASGPAASFLPED